MSSNKARHKKQNKMTTIEILKAKQNEIKNQIKFTTSYVNYLNACNNLEKYTFTSLSGEQKCLIDLNYTYSPKLMISTIQNFCEIYEICFDKKIENKEWLNLIKDLKIIFKTEINDEYWKLIQSIERDMK